MSKLIDAAVTSSDGGDTYDLQCPVTDGSCGDAGVPFTSTGWPTKKAATARLQEHVDEHKGLGVMSSLEDFRVKHGLAVDAETGVVTVKDLP